MKTKILLVTAVACLFSATVSKAQTVPSYVPTIGLVGWWPFNGNANDESGNGNNGTVNGATLTADRFGNANAAHYFDGIQSYIEMNFPQSIEFSVSAWFNPAVSNPGIFGIFQHKDNCSRGGGYIIEIENNSIRFQATNCGQCGNNCANYFNFSNISNTNINQWYHVVLTCDINGIYSIYLEDSLVHTNTNASTLTQYNVPFSVGKHHDGIDLYYFQGKIDDIGYWNRALTQQEITALYQSNNCSVPAYVPTNGLVGYWPFCGNANDVSGNGNNGAVNGATLTSDRNGNANEAYSFDGVDDYISGISSGLDVSGTNRVSISSWIEVDSFAMTPSASKIITHTDLSNQNSQQYALSIGNNGEIYFLAGNGDFESNGPNFSNSVIQLNTWTHLLMTYDGNSINFYLNGQLVFSKPEIDNFNQNLINYFVFSSASNSTFNKLFNGQLDDIGIWNRALTQQEVSALYTSQSCNSHAITADGPTIFCAGNSVNLTSNIAGATYQWKKNGVNIATNATSRSYKVTAAGSYTCVATCNGNLVTSNAIQATTKGNTNPVVSALGATTFCVGDSVTLSCNNLGSNYSIQWYRTGVSMENATAYTKVVTQPGTYKVVSKNNTNGCSRISSSSVVVAVNCRMSDPNTPSVQAPINDESIKSTEAASSSILYIYPNPAENRFTVEFMGVEQHGTATLEIINGLGQMVAYKDVYVSDGYLREEFEISNESKGGICLVRLVIGDEVYDSKVVLR